MRYQVRFVDDGALPEGVEWTFVRQAGLTYLFVKASAIDATGGCAALDRARDYWLAHECERVPSRVRSEVGHLRNLTALLLAAYGVPAAKAASAII